MQFGNYWHLKLQHDGNWMIQAFLKSVQDEDFKPSQQKQNYEVIPCGGQPAHLLFVFWPLCDPSVMPLLLPRAPAVKTPAPPLGPQPGVPRTCLQVLIFWDMDTLSHFTELQGSFTLFLSPAHHMIVKTIWTHQRVESKFNPLTTPWHSPYKL